VQFDLPRSAIVISATFDCKVKLISLPALDSSMRTVAGSRLEAIIVRTGFVGKLGTDETDRAWLTIFPPQPTELCYG